MADTKVGIYSLIAAAGILITGCNKKELPAPARPSGLEGIEGAIIREQNRIIHPELPEYTNYASLRGDKAKSICDVLEYKGTFQGQNFVEFRSTMNPPAMDISAISDDGSKWMEIDKKHVSVSILNLKDKKVLTTLVHVKDETP